MKINIHFKILLNVSLLTCISELIGYFFKTPFNIRLLISIIIVFLLNILLRKRIKSTNDFELLDIFFFSALIAVILLKISIPDYYYDTQNYHIYLQQNVNFIDKINFDFFPTHVVNCFSFSLGDKMNYLFRYFLGYRLGTILSYYIIVVLFYQTKRILKLIFNDQKAIPLIALWVCSSSYIINALTGSYYIDTLSIVFILEIIIQLLECPKLFENKYNLLFISFLTGVSTAIKSSNLVLIVPILIYFIIKNKNKFNKKMILYYILGLIIFCLPFICYIFDNIRLTNNPIFPNYNNIFKSIYYGSINPGDERFGIPKHLLPIWPIYTSIIYEGYGDNWKIKDYIWAFGYLVTVVNLIILLLHKKEKHNDTLSSIVIISIILTFVWIFFLAGYMRYALIIPILYSIVIGSHLLFLLNKLNLKNLENALLVFEKYWPLQLIIGISILLLNYNSVIIENYPFILKDRGINKISINGVWGSLEGSVGYTTILRESNIPIYNIVEKEFESSEYDVKMYNDRFKNQDVYVLIPYFFSLNYEKEFKKNNFNYTKIKEYNSSDIPILKKHDKLYLYKLNKKKND